MDKIIMCGYSVHRQYTSQGEKGRFYAFRLQSHGECDARLNGEPLRLKKGDLLMMVPGDRLAIHKPFNAADASDTSGDYYLLCQGDWIASWFRRLNGRRRLEVPTGESILDLWKLIIRETHRLPFIIKLRRQYSRRVKQLRVSLYPEPLLAASNAGAVSGLGACLADKPVYKARLSDIRYAYHHELESSRSSPLGIPIYPVLNKSARL